MTGQRGSVLLRVAQAPAAPTSPGRVLGMQTLRPHPDPLTQNLRPRVIPAGRTALERGDGPWTQIGTAEKLESDQI